MSKLIESIINEDYVSARSLFETRLNEIKSSKLYEKKKMVPAEMDEAFGGLSIAQIEAKKKAGYRKAADVLPDPWDDRKKGKFLYATTKYAPTKTEKATKPVRAKRKKKVSEDVQVQPDPEGRVRGGATKAAKPKSTEKNIFQKGWSRTKARLSYAAGHAVGKGIVGAANLAGQAASAISDPLPAAGAAIKSAKPAATRATKSVLSGLSGYGSMNESSEIQKG